MNTSYLNRLLFSSLSILILIFTFYIAIAASAITFLFEVFHLGYNRTKAFFHGIYSYTSPPHPYSDWVVYYTHQLSKGSIQATPYSVVTEDGHQLTMHRLSLTNKPPSTHLKKVVYFQHGFFESSLNWLATGERSLSFLFVRQNWDVWLGNNRGNVYTSAPKNHIHISHKLRQDEYQFTKPDTTHETLAEGTHISTQNKEDQLLNSILSSHIHISPNNKPKPKSLDSTILTPSEISSVNSVDTGHTVGTLYSEKDMESLPSPLFGLTSWFISLFPNISMCVPNHFKFPINSPFVPKTEGWDLYDLAYKDVPCMLKYIEEITNSPIHCIGQSQGAIVLLLAEKIVNQTNRFPIQTLHLISAPIILRTLTSMPFLLRLIITFGLTYTQQALAIIHLYIMIIPKSLLSSAAHFISSYVFGFYTTSIGPQDTNIIFQHTPSGAPCLKHCEFWRSLVDSDECVCANGVYPDFKHLPKSCVHTPTHFFFGKKDNLVDVDKSINYLNKKLEFTNMKIEVWSEWSHIDFGWGSDRYIDFYPYLIYLLNSFAIN